PAAAASNGPVAASANRAIASRTEGSWSRPSLSCTYFIVSCEISTYFYICLLQRSRHLLLGRPRSRRPSLVRLPRDRHDLLVEDRHGVDLAAQPRGVRRVWPWRSAACRHATTASTRSPQACWASPSTSSARAC